MIQRNHMMSAHRLSDVRHGQLLSSLSFLPARRELRIGWRFWKLHDGLLRSVFIAYTWHPGVFERSSSKQGGFKNPGYHAFRDKEQAKREASAHTYWTPFVIGSVAMWGEVIEHENGWRSEFAAVRSIIDITGNISFGSKNWLLLELREKYRCAVVAELSEMKVRAAKQGRISLS